VVVELAGGDFVGGLDDEGGQLRLELAEVLIDQRAGLFQHGEGVDDLERNASWPMSKWMSDRAVCAP